MKWVNLYFLQKYFFPIPYSLFPIPYSLFPIPKSADPKFPVPKFPVPKSADPKFPVPGSEVPGSEVPGSRSAINFGFLQNGDAADEIHSMHPVFTHQCRLKLI